MRNCHAKSARKSGRGTQVHDKGNQPLGLNKLAFSSMPSLTTEDSYTSARSLIGVEAVVEKILGSHGEKKLSTSFVREMNERGEKK